MADWNWIISIVYEFVFWMVAFLAAIQLAQILFPMLGWDKSKYYVIFMKNLRKLSLRGKIFRLTVQKSYYLKNDIDPKDDLKKLIDNSLSDFKPIISDKSTNYKISALVKRYDFDIELTIFVHEEDNSWIFLEQSMDIKYNKIKDGLNTVFNNLQRFDSPIITPKTNKVDVIIDAEELKLFKALLEEVGRCVIGNVSLTQIDGHTFIKISDKPEIELTKKVTDFVNLGHV